jgi:hypothetical protein
MISDHVAMTPTTRGMRALPVEQALNLAKETLR